MDKALKTKRDPKIYDEFCHCRPICKYRRREWNGELLQTSAEMLMKNQLQEQSRWPKKITIPESSAPLAAASAEHVKKIEDTNLFRYCNRPIEVNVDTPFLKYTALAKKLGAWDMVRRTCQPFCACGACCPCDAGNYQPDSEQTSKRRTDMRTFDKRVKMENNDMRIMYDKPC